MSAPQSVVEAVAQAMYEGTEGHEYLWRSYESSYWDVWVESAQPVADVAWAAAKPAVLREAATRFDAERVKAGRGIFGLLLAVTASAAAKMLRHWADEHARGQS